MGTPDRYWPTLNIETWGWMLFKIWLGLIWASSMLLLTPVAIERNIEVTGLIIWTVGTMIGAVVSVIGLFMGTSRHEKTSLRGMVVELVGLSLFVGGPIQYTLVLIGIQSTSEETQISSATVNFAIAMVLAITARALSVGLRYYKEATDPNKRGVR